MNDRGESAAWPLIALAFMLFGAWLVFRVAITPAEQECERNGGTPVVDLFYRVQCIPGEKP